MSRNLPIGNSPNQTQQVTVTLGCNGRSYIICDEGQMRFLLGELRAQIENDLSAKIKPTNKQLDVLIEEIAVTKGIKNKAQLREMAMAQFAKKSEGMVMELVEKGREFLPYATTQWILARLSPEERQRWRDNYRFSGVSRKRV